MAVPFWMERTYITFSKTQAKHMREPQTTPSNKYEALTREKVHFSVSKWVDGKPDKPSPSFLSAICSDTSEE